jgi:hypothetical protein
VLRSEHFTFLRARGLAAENLSQHTVREGMLSGYGSKALCESVPRVCIPTLTGASMGFQSLSCSYGRTVTKRPKALGATNNPLRRPPFIELDRSKGCVPTTLVNQHSDHAPRPRRRTLQTPAPGYPSRHNKIGRMSSTILAPSKAQSPYTEAQLVPSVGEIRTPSTP